MAPLHSGFHSAAFVSIVSVRAPHLFEESGFVFKEWMDAEHQAGALMLCHQRDGATAAIGRDGHCFLKQFASKAPGFTLPL